MKKAYELMIFELKQKKIIVGIYIFIFLFSHVAIILENFFNIHITDIEGSFIAMTIANAFLVATIYAFNKSIYKDIGVKPLDLLKSMLLLSFVTILVNTTVWLKYFEYVKSMENKSPTAFLTIIVIYTWLWLYAIYIRCMKSHNKKSFFTIKTLSKEERKLVNPSINKLWKTEKIINFLFPLFMYALIFRDSVFKKLYLPLIILAIMCFALFIIITLYYIIILVPREDSLE